MVGMNCCSESYSPLVADWKASMTCEGSALLKDAKSPDMVRKDFDRSAAAFLPIPIWSKKLPNCAAPEIASFLDSPSDLAALLPKASMSAAAGPKMVFDLDRVSLRSE